MMKLKTLLISNLELIYLVNNAGTNIPEHFTKVKRKNMERLVKIKYYFII